METWKDIFNFEGLYQISTEGRVKSLKRTGTYVRSKEFKINYKEKILVPLINEKGYCCVILYKNKKHKRFRIHRIVAAAFIPNPKNKPFVNHINGNPFDNRKLNLEWTTQKENIYHSKHVTGNGKVISIQKLKKLLSDNLTLSLKEFVEILILNSA